MYGNAGIVRKMDKFWEENYNKQTSQWSDFIDSYRFYANIKLEELLVDHPHREVLGMSKAGGCTRKGAILRSGLVQEGTIPGSTAATFFIGHMLEPMALATLEQVGCEIVGTQFRVSIDDIAESEADALISWEEEDLDSALLSVKSAGYKKSGVRRLKDGTVKWERRGFAELPLEGVARSQPTHYAQAQMEMLGSELTKELYLVIAKDIVKAMENDPNMHSLTFYAEVIPFELDIANNIAERNAYILEDAEQLNFDDGYIWAPYKKWVRIDPFSPDNNRKVYGWNICDYCEVIDKCKELYND